MKVNDTNIRIGTKLYSNFRRFPYGFKKSGDFSIVEANILSVFGHTLQLLELGTLKPESDEEKHFIQVSKRLADPETTIERTWLKYIKLASTRKNFFMLQNSSYNITVTNEDTEEFNNNDLEIID
jgi:uncharacterized protein YifE (UPF0438 family)